jgi:hypothetical protein
MPNQSVSEMKSQRVLDPSAKSFYGLFLKRSKNVKKISFPNILSKSALRKRDKFCLLKRAVSVSLLATTFVGFQVSAQTNDPYAPQATNNPLDPLGLYFNVGALGDFGVTGYGSAATDRNARVAYQLEV